MAKFSGKTLDALMALVDSVDGVTSFRVYGADGFTPKGEVKDCDVGIVAKEWVDQTTGGGFSGDEFAGTVTWRLGRHYVVVQYHT